MSTPVGVKARCGRCSQVFRVPAIPGARPIEPGRRTTSKVKMINLDDLPTEVRREIGRTESEPSDEAPLPVSEPPEGPVVRRFSSTEARRRAFDLTDEGSPARRSGVQMVNVADLLGLDDEGEE